VLDHNLYGFNSLSLYNFRVDEATLQEFVGSNFEVGIDQFNVTGSFPVNKLIMSHDFKLEDQIELRHKVELVKQVKVEGRKKLQDQVVSEVITAGYLEIEINL